MTLFVDSSGILALVDRDDAAHAGAVDAFTLGRSEALSTHAYVIVETLAVARRRFGPAVAADLIDRVIPALDVAPVDAALHADAVTAFRDTIESSVSLVDRTSFAFMRREGIERAIVLDADFRTAGFETLP
ncbi:MAG: PIN domain-containing protein [Chloroflexi bacterium]|nr:PIN domain-containing protein [Chloroflexota bacterium]